MTTGIVAITAAEMIIVTADRVTASAVTMSRVNIAIQEGQAGGNDGYIERERAH